MTIIVIGTANLTSLMVHRTIGRVLQNWCQLSELAEASRIKMKEDPEKLQNGLQHIKDWLAEQPHLYANTDDQWLASYIRGCRFNLEKVKEKIDLYYTCRSTAPEFYQLHHRDDKFKELFRKGFYLPLPKLKDPAGPRICLIRNGTLELTQQSILDALCVAQIIEKVMIMDDDNAIVTGSTCVVDFKGSNILDVFQLSTSQMKKVIACQQDSVPFISLNTAIINLPNGSDFVLNAVKGLLDDKNQRSFQLYGENFEDMYKEFIPKEVMPNEYGGEGGSLQEIIDQWMEKFEQYDEWLDNDLQYHSNESKRPGRPKTAQDMFGMESLAVTGFFDIFNKIK